MPNCNLSEGMIMWKKARRNTFRTKCLINNEKQFILVTEGTVGLVYVNSEAAMSFRMYDYQNRNLGLFSFGKGKFSRIEMRKREYE